MAETKYNIGGQVALVTGAGSGIGRATSLLLARSGASVAVLDANFDAAISVAREIGETAKAIWVDVADPASVSECIENVVSHFGKLDIAVNNAAISKSGPVGTLPIEVWREVMSVDLDGVFYCMKAEIDAMLANGSGSIINVASMVGLVAIRGLSSYAVAKHGVVGLTRVAALDYARSGIRVNAVAPGRIATPQLVADVTAEVSLEDLADRSPMGKLGSPDDVAHVIAFLASRDAAFVTGTIFAVDGGYLAGAGR